MRYDEAKRLLQAMDVADLGRLLNFTNFWLQCGDEKEFHKGIDSLGSFLGFEYVLCVHMQTAYDRIGPIHFTNISNPVGWMSEYDARGFVKVDPVRNELERQLASGDKCGFILWDHYDRPLDAAEQEVIDRRCSWGLRHGFSVFCNSTAKEAMFLVSFASTEKRPDDRARNLATLQIPHITRCRKRIDLMSRTGGLSERETAVGEWLIEGKTNAEIAQLLGISERTAKFHVGNILQKLGATNRQHAVSILIAARYIS